jgi:phosphoketolase
LAWSELVILLTGGFDMTVLNDLDRFHLVMDASAE